MKANPRASTGVYDAHLRAGSGANSSEIIELALLDNLVARGLEPAVSRLFGVDGAQAARAIRRTFSHHTLIRRCEVHKAGNITERIAPLACLGTQGSASGVGLGDAAKAERPIHNLARCLEYEAPGVSSSILKGIDEITVSAF